MPDPTAPGEVRHLGGLSGELLPAWQSGGGLGRGPGGATRLLGRCGRSPGGDRLLSLAAGQQSEDRGEGDGDPVLHLDFSLLSGVV